ncbi:MAG: toprim domain-containing protein [Lewinella sp.]|nr:toprim domain-containing protein [Lewinella sp.]
MPDLLSYFGHEPVRTAKQGSEYWYVSPFRYEKAASFHTSYLGGKWIWNDFGRGDVQGSGTVIGFLEMHENVDVSGALKILKELFPHKGRAVSTESLRRMPLFKNLSISEKKESNDPIADKLVIREIKDQIWDKALIGYLAGERKINHRLAVKYLKHIQYENIETGKIYNTLGFENESGDFECRDKFFKGIIKNPNAVDRAPAKDISYIPGTEKGRVAVFEGFMDYLTVLTIKNQPVLPVDVIILNMVNMRRRGIDFIKQGDYEQVFTFFDNDSAGEKTAQMFLEEPELKEKVEPQNHLYKGFKDYNQFWQQKEL